MTIPSFPSVISALVWMLPFAFFLGVPLIWLDDRVKRRKALRGEPQTYIRFG